MNITFEKPILGESRQNLAIIDRWISDTVDKLNMMQQLVRRQQELIGDSGGLSDQAALLEQDTAELRQLIEGLDTGKAPKNHASSGTTYGKGNASNYGHVKLSDTYTSSVSGANAAGGVGASQNALYSAYDALNDAKAPKSHASTATTYGIGTASNYGHIKLSDTYASKTANAAAANGVGASQNALYNAYNTNHGLASHCVVLWEGGYYMTAGHDITLSQNVSAQPHGIVLHWTAYIDGAKKNYDNCYFFIPKLHIATGFSNTGIGMMLASSNGTYVARKYVYVYDNHIKGNDNNNKVDTQSNISYHNNYWVLARVLGV